MILTQVAVIEPVSIQAVQLGINCALWILSIRDIAAHP